MTHKKIKQDWNYVTRERFEELQRYKPYEWTPTTARKTYLYKRYKLYWSSSEGGLWVEEP